MSVRAMILSLRRFQIADPESIKLLEKQWAAYHKENGLNFYGEADSDEPLHRDCVGSNAQ